MHPAALIVTRWRKGLEPRTEASGGAGRDKPAQSPATTRLFVWWRRP